MPSKLNLNEADFTIPFSVTKTTHGSTVITDSDDQLLVPEELANARLIAAAPDLLAALTLCQSALAMMIAPDAIKNTTVLNAFAQANEAEAKSRAALAKAGA